MLNSSFANAFTAVNCGNKFRALDNYYHFEIVAKEIANLSKNLGRKIKVVDSGAGHARYWLREELKSCLDLYISELHLVDANLQRIDLLPTYKEIVILRKGLIPQDLNDFAEDFFDIACAFGLIEHLSFHDAMYFLYELDRVTRFTSVLYTPNGLVWQPPSENNWFNAHISGWTPRQLRDLGWKKVYGHIGLKFQFGPYGLRKKEFNRITKLIHLSVLPVILIFPKIAFSFTAIKRNKNVRIYLQN